MSHGSFVPEYVWIHWCMRWRGTLSPAYY